MLLNEMLDRGAHVFDFYLLVVKLQVIKRHVGEVAPQKVANKAFPLMLALVHHGFDIFYIHLAAAHHAVDAKFHRRFQAKMIGVFQILRHHGRAATHKNAVPALGHAVNGFHHDLVQVLVGLPAGVQAADQRIQQGAAGADVFEQFQGDVFFFQDLVQKQVIENRPVPAPSGFKVFFQLHGQGVALATELAGEGDSDVVFVFCAFFGLPLQLNPGCDALIYQDLDALKAAVRSVNPTVTQFETSCFDGQYITGDVTPLYLQSMEDKRNLPQQQKIDDSDGFDGQDGEQLDLNLVQAG